MSRTSLAFASAALLGLAACAQGSAPAGSSSSPAHLDERNASVADAPSRPILGRVRTRDRELLIQSTEDGPRFSIAALDGAILASDLTEADLFEKDRDLFRVVTSSRAYLDATLTRPETRPASLRGDDAFRPHFQGDL